MNEKLLIERVKSGDKNAFEQLYDLYQHKVYNLAFRMTGNYHDACDAAQSVFIRVYRAIDNFRGDCAFSTWIYHITVNVCKDELRARGRRNEESIDQVIETDTGSMPKLCLADDSEPEESLEKKELSSRLNALIDTLPQDYRTILVLREQYELSYQNIAELLDISLGTVKSRINRSRACLAKKIIANQKLFPEYSVYYNKIGRSDDIPD